MSRTRIAHFENYAQAEPVRLFLIAHGIHAGLHSKPGLARFWFVGGSTSGVSLDVPSGEAQPATDVLVSTDKDMGLLAAATRCPECHSLRVEFPQVTRKSMLTNLVIGLLAEVGLLERQYYCEDCHCMWPKPGKPLRKPRPHAAPDFFLEGLHADGGESERTLTKTNEPCRFRARQTTKNRGGSHATKELGLHSPWRKSLGLGLIFGLLSAVVCGSSFLGAESLAETAPGPGHKESPTYRRDVLPILMGKCGRCHNEQTRFLPNWLDYTAASQKRWEIKRRIWDSWHGMYFKQPMPTGNSPESLAITDEERTIIRDWAEAGAPYGVAPVYGSGQSKEEKIESGKRLFSTICAACHQPTGTGIPGRFPPLAGSDFLNADKHRAIKIVVNGFQGEVVVNGQTFNNSMPKFPLSDQDIACALTYVYNSFGNSGKEVMPEEVRRVRGEKNDVLPVAQGPKGNRPEEKSPFE